MKIDSGTVFIGKDYWHASFNGIIKNMNISFYPNYCKTILNFYT